jgi:hypothetical protein
MSPFRRCARWVGALMLAGAAVVVTAATASADDAPQSDSSVVVQSDGDQPMAVPMQDSIWG